MDKLNRCLIPQDPLHAITLLATNTVDMEPFVQTAADKARLTNPNRFSGEHTVVYFPVPYTAPYEQERFDSLKRLTVAMRDAAGMRTGYHFRGAVYLDANAWRGHFDEELFQVMLKYLYDCCLECALVICADFNLFRELKALKQVCLCIGFAVDTLTLNLEDQSDLSLILDNCFERRHAKLLGASRKLLVSSLHEHMAVIPKRIQLLDRAADELCRLACCPGKETIIQANHVTEYLADPCGILCCIAGQPLLERRNPYELQL